MILCVVAFARPVASTTSMNLECASAPSRTSSALALALLVPTDVIVACSATAGLVSQPVMLWVAVVLANSGAHAVSRSAPVVPGQRMSTMANPSMSPNAWFSPAIAQTNVYAEVPEPEWIDQLGEMTAWRSATTR